MTLRIAVLGAGRIGQVHAKTVAASADAELVAVADAFAEAADKLAAQWDCAVGEVDVLINDAAIDAIIICTPTDTHADLIEQAARAGKAIFCEKPIDLNADRVRACLEVVEQSQAKLMVGFNRRFDPHFAALECAVRGGAVGEVEQVIITSRDPAPPPVEYIKRSGGLFRDMMIHDFDMARFLLGEEPVSVSAVGSALADPSLSGIDVDTATAVLTTSSGKQAVITNSRRASYGYDQRAEVHGSAGMASMDNPRVTSLQTANAAGYTVEPLHDFFMTRYTEAYANELSSFVRWVGTGQGDVPSGLDGLKALMLADAAEASLSSGKQERVE
ncbi:MAG: inositol 2-dehydrogenase [Granulosicoccaceae bacterium]